MSRAFSYLLMTATLILLGCGRSEQTVRQSAGTDISKEELAGIDILSIYATHLIKLEGFPNLDPYRPSTDDDIFRAKLVKECPKAMGAEVLFGKTGYSIGPRPMELIAGDKTNWVNPRIVRALNTSGVVNHSEIEFDYTTLDGKSGSIPATILAIDRTIEGREVRLILSTERTQQFAAPNGP